MSPRPWRRGHHRSRPDHNESPRVIYKRYKLPDGSVEELTREEFDNAVEVFRMLLEADRKRQKEQFKSSTPENPAVCGEQSLSELPSP